MRNRLNGWTASAVFILLAACSNSVEFIEDGVEFSDPFADDSSEPIADDGKVDEAVSPENDADLVQDIGPDLPPDAFGGPPPSIGWILHLEGGNNFNATSMIEAGSDRYVIAGFLFDDETQMDDLWMASVEDEALVWQKAWGGTEPDSASQIIQSRDGGIMIVGKSESFFGHGSSTWVLKADADGNIMWQKAIGDALCMANAGFEDHEGNLLIFGRNYPETGYDSQACMMKLDPNGEVLIQKWIGGSDRNEIAGAAELTDGSIAAVGSTGSSGPCRSGAWIMRLDSGLNVIWQKTLGGAEAEDAAAVAAGLDGCMLVVGSIEREAYPHGRDMIVVKLDPDGRELFHELIVGAGESYGRAAAPASDGGFLVAGSTTMEGGFETIAVLKLDAVGRLAWQVGIGGSFYLFVSSVMESEDGGIAVLWTGYTSDLPVSTGVWLAKLYEDGEPAGDCSLLREPFLYVQDSTATLQDCDAPLTEFGSASFVPDSSPSDLALQVSRPCPE